MAGELSERLIRRSARIAARQTMLIRSINQRFSSDTHSSRRDKTLTQIASNYDALPLALNRPQWSPFTDSTSNVVNGIVQNMKGSRNGQ
jgi:hypothetical protein